MLLACPGFVGCRYFRTYILAFLPLFFMIVPPGILLNLAFANSGVKTAGNWFNITPDSNFKYYAVWMMILHNIQAWVLWVSAALHPAQQRRSGLLRHSTAAPVIEVVLAANTAAEAVLLKSVTVICRYTREPIHSLISDPAFNPLISDQC